MRAHRFRRIALSTVDNPPALVPPHVLPAARPLNRLAFVARFLQNPLRVIPDAVYEQDIVPFSGGRTPFQWITEPELIKAILLDHQQNFAKGLQIRVLAPLLGRGILTSEWPDWKWQHQTSTPMFRRQELVKFVPTFVAATHAILNNWRRVSAGSRHDVARDMTRLTFEVVCATLLPSADATVANRVAGSTNQFQNSSNWHRLYLIANAPDWLPRPGRRAMQQAVGTLRSLVADMLRKQREVADGRDHLMHRLVHAHNPETGAPMSDEQLIDNLLTFYLAGHETTAMALTWTLYLLARSPQWTSLLKTEIADVTKGAPVAAEHIDKLALTQQVLKESMRLFPPVPLLSRQAVDDIRIGAHEIKAGTLIVMPVYAIHRHRRRWRDPNVFDPRRFAPENDSKISRYQYLPFGAGPRICIGMAFALIEATAILATIMQAAHFATVDGHEPIPVARITLHPKGGMPLKVWTT